MTPDQIRAWRLAHGLTQEQLADILGVYKYTVQRWEWGQSNPPYMLEFALARLDQILPPPEGIKAYVTREQLAREAIGYA